jgi:hypothetical protein
MIFGRWRAAENSISGQIATVNGKWNLRLFRWDSPPELNTKNLYTSPSFLYVTYWALSNSRFGMYGILKIDFAAEFCFWREQWLNGTQLLGLELTKTLEVPNSITVGNSLSVPMVHNTTPNGRWFTGYNYRKLDQFAELEFQGDSIFRPKSRFWQNFAMTFPETLNISCH